MSDLDVVFKATAQSMETAIAVCKTTLAEAVSESECWRFRSLLRCFKALQAAEARADRGALWQEAVRLVGGRLPVSREALHPGDQEFLSRFGLRLGGIESQPVLLLDAKEDHDPLHVCIDEALQLDVSLRQPYQTAVADALLLRFSRYLHYRTPTQKAAIQALACMPSGASLLVTMPTGAGKSLLFELAPAWWQTTLMGLERACAVVIVPTVALALAHASHFATHPGLKGSAALVSELSGEKRGALLDAFRRGEVPLLFLSPEMALSTSVRQVLIEASRHSTDKPLGLNARLMGVFIDEAHIIESWGRSFRPDFQRLPGLVHMLRKTSPEIRTILLSATIGDAARNEIIRAYEVSGRFLAIDARVPRYELDLVTYRCPNAQERMRRVIELVDRLPRPALVYTTLVTDALELGDTLAKRGYKRLAVYTGEMGSEGERKRVVDDWLADRLDLVVATSAFGMGIDKRDVRAVVHACVPESPARYYQEIGRASRDGHQGLAVILWVGSAGSDNDWRLARRQAVSGWLTPELLASRWQTLLANAQTSSPDEKTGEPRFAMVLDAGRNKSGDIKGDYHRLWNMSLLNLLQRSGLLQVDVVEDSAEMPVWRITLLANWLLESPLATDLRWVPVIALRDAEQQASREDLEHFRCLIDGSEPNCILTGTFDLVEAGSNIVDPCGRCEFCRRNEFTPPQEVTFHGLKARWSEPCFFKPHAFVAGVSVVHPLDEHFGEGLRDLVIRLAAAGIEQFVAPSGVAERLSLLLKDSPCQFGFVHDFETLERADAAIANLPTAVLISVDYKNPRQLLQRLESLEDVAREQCFVLVVSSDLQVEGRPMAQVASVVAPIRERALESMARRLVL
ncbi:ATP-dependent DNA helicase RecQ [Pseudomonas sp. TMW22090]|uniref:DEAD/DEAH box helicase n=1 Tax=Pseudomonas sp. TMW22090 TaxID=2506434 RepID=UPI001F0F7DDF|nr:DEAD/DEAH box helicase [Pseudomonas sp. TMW22090]MCH4880074.1 ATP-dependent DNA helicase RecQ [Pseudomonas sp. TMW22090]